MASRLTRRITRRQFSPMTDHRMSEGVVRALDDEVLQREPLQPFQDVFAGSIQRSKRCLEPATVLDWAALRATAGPRRGLLAVRARRPGRSVHLGGGMRPRHP